MKREELFVSSKLNNPYHRPEHVRPMLEKTLLDLRLDQVDMFLMHWSAVPPLSPPPPPAPGRPAAD